MEYRIKDMLGIHPQNIVIPNLSSHSFGLTLPLPLASVTAPVPLPLYPPRFLSSYPSFSRPYPPPSTFSNKCQLSKNRSSNEKQGGAQKFL